MPIDPIEALVAGGALGTYIGFYGGLIKNGFDFLIWFLSKKEEDDRNIIKKGLNGIVIFSYSMLKVCLITGTLAALLSMFVTRDLDLVSARRYIVIIRGGFLRNRYLIITR